MRNSYLLLCFLILVALPAHAIADPAVFNIMDYRAKGNVVTLNTKAIQAAIDACSASGGGTVLFQAGRFVSGTIFLRNHVTLFLEAGAILEGSKDLKDYPVTISKVRSYADNNYYLVIDETAPNCHISEYALKNIILKELQGK